MTLSAVVRASAPNSRSDSGTAGSSLPPGCGRGHAAAGGPESPAGAGPGPGGGENRRFGRLAEAGLRHAARPSETSLALRQALAARTYYLSGMLFVGPMIITFVAIKIMPAFFKIFEDFEVEVPAATILLVRLLANPFVQLAAELPAGCGWGLVSVCDCLELRVGAGADARLPQARGTRQYPASSGPGGRTRAGRWVKCWSRSPIAIPTGRSPHGCGVCRTTWRPDAIGPKVW